MLDLLEAWLLASRGMHGLGCIRVPSHSPEQRLSPQPWP